jgi:hypothetical protein
VFRVPSQPTGQKPDLWQPAAEKILKKNSFHKKSRPGCQTEPFCPVGIGSPIFMKEAHRMKSYATVT